MSFRNRFGITSIVKGVKNNLMISWDYSNNPNKKHPVLSITPDRGLNMHHHVPLTRTQAKKLKKWLEQYLKETK